VTGVPGSSRDRGGQPNPGRPGRSSVGRRREGSAPHRTREFSSNAGQVRFSGRPRSGRSVGHLVAMQQADHPIYAVGGAGAGDSWAEAPGHRGTSDGGPTRGSRYKPDRQRGRFTGRMARRDSRREKHRRHGSEGEQATRGARAGGWVSSNARNRWSVRTTPVEMDHHGPWGLKRGSSARSFRLGRDSTEGGWGQRGRTRANKVR